MKNISTGTVSECLADLFIRHPDIKDELLRFAKVSDCTLSHWRLGHRLPTGEKMLRLQYFLVFKGYNLFEFQNISKTIFDLGACIVFDLVSVEQVGQRLGFVESKRIYDYFRKGSLVTAKKREAVDGILTEYKKDLEEKMLRFDEKSTSVSNSSKAVSVPFDLSSMERLITEFEISCKRTKELGQTLLNGPVEARVKMRNKMGTGKEPLLQITWQTLNNLLREKTQYEPN